MKSFLFCILICGLASAGGAPTLVSKVSGTNTPVTISAAVTGQGQSFYCLITNSSGSAAQVIVTSGGVTCINNTIAATNGGFITPYLIKAPSLGNAIIMLNTSGAASIEGSFEIFTSPSLN